MRNMQVYPFRIFLQAVMCMQSHHLPRQARPGSKAKCLALLVLSHTLLTQNHIQVQPAPLQHTHNPPSHNWAGPPLPEKPTPSSLTAMPPPSPGSQGTSASLSLPPSGSKTIWHSIQVFSQLSSTYWGGKFPWRKFIYSSTPALHSLPWSC